MPRYSTAPGAALSRARRAMGGIAAGVAILLLALAVLMPLFWMVSTSLSRRTDVAGMTDRWLPERPTLLAYRKLVVEQPFLRYYANSLFIAVVVSVSTVLLSTLTGFALSNKYSYRGKGLAFAFVMATMMLPFELIMIPLYILMKSLSLLNTYWAVIVPGALSAFGVFLLRQCIDDIPSDFLDAGRIDGASEPRIFARIVVPLSLPVMAALLTFTFVGAWNSYFWPLVVISKERLRTLTLAVAYMQGFYSTDYPLVLAAAVLSSVPIMVVFLFAQQFFIKSITMSGIKG